MRYELPPLRLPLSHRPLWGREVEQNVRIRDVEQHRARNSGVKARHLQSAVSRSPHTWQPLLQAGRELRFDGTRTSLPLGEGARTACTARRRGIRAAVLVAIARVVEVARPICTASWRV